MLRSNRNAIYPFNNKFSFNFGSFALDEMQNVFLHGEQEEKTAIFAKEWREMCVQYALVHINVRYVQYALYATKELNVNTFTIQKSSSFT